MPSVKSILVRVRDPILTLLESLTNALVSYETYAILTEQKSHHMINMPSQSGKNAQANDNIMKTDQGLRI